MNDGLPPCVATSPRSKPLLLSTMLVLLLTSVTAMSGCGSKSPLVVRPDPPRLAPPPPELMEAEPQNLRQRLRQSFGVSPGTGTEPSGS